ncbi:MAG: polysaccharide deacetylase family protein [Flavisolibacter sp.]
MNKEQELKIMIRSYLGNAKRYVSNLLDTAGVVLLYHRVIQLPEDPQLLAVNPDHFYQQVRYLQKDFDLLRIEDFYDCLVHRRLPKKAVILSFDDGYADNFHQALPILESLKAQAVFYVSTAKLDSLREMWWDDLERIFLTPGLPEALSLAIGQREYHWRTKTSAEKKGVYQQLHTHLKYSSIADREAALNQLHQWAGISESGRPDYRMMTTAEVREMSYSPSALIGAHTHNHPALSILDYEGQLAEMLGSKTILESVIHHKVEHFSYPYGTRADFNHHSMRAAREAGFKMVCANYYGQVHRWTSPLALPRVLVRDWSLEEFKLKTKRIFQY